MGSAPVGLFKINFNAAWVRDNKEVDIGVVIRDHMGEFYAGLSKGGCKALSAENAELEAAREAVTFALEAGFRKIILERDNITVINAIRISEFGFASVSAVVADIIKMGLSCNKVSFYLVTRYSNFVAHHLAKYASSVFDYMV